MADDSPEPVRDVMLTPLTRVQFAPIGGDIYDLLIDGETIGDLHLAPESREWLATLPTAEEHDQTVAQMRQFFQSQGVPL